MATYGDPFPGSVQPAWWYGNTITTGTATIYPQQYAVAAAPAQVSKPGREQTAVEWLRSRVEELCDLAWEAA